MASALASKVAFSAKVVVPQRTRPARQAVVCSATPDVKAETSRRAVLGLFAATVFGAAAVHSAEAITIPSQESTGGINKAGSLPTSTTRATASGYNMEGTKKRGVSAKRKAKLLAKLKSEAAKAT